MHVKNPGARSGIFFGSNTLKCTAGEDTGRYNYEKRFLREKEKKVKIWKKEER
jgi:hypothetical protein